MKQLTSLLLLVLALETFANDGVYYTNGSFLVPVKETDVSVKKEILEIKLCKDGYAEVCVDYTLYNNKEGKTVTMAFEAAAPYEAWAPFSREGKHPFIQDFIVEMGTCRAAGISTESDTISTFNRSSDFQNHLLHMSIS